VTEGAVLDAMFASLADADQNRSASLALPQTLAQARHQFDCIARQSAQVWSPATWSAEDLRCGVG
jgi:hypothetical protein